MVQTNTPFSKNFTQIPLKLPSYLCSTINYYLYFFSYYCFFTDNPIILVINYYKCQSQTVILKICSA